MVSTPRNSNKPADEPSDELEDINSPVFVAYFPEDLASSPRITYKSLKDATKFVNSPEGKSNGARFKRFGTPKEAHDFLASGDSVLSPLRRFENDRIPVATPTEPVVPFPSLTRIQMNDLKRAIDKSDFETFEKLVETNPRYIINTSGDVAAIVMEGFRYNCLHIAAKTGQLKIIKKLFSYLHDIKFLSALYGTEEADVSFRQTNIIDSYLNTPDKGNCDTPLHFASKFGQSEVVRILTMEKLLDRNIRNKEGKTPLETACSRYNGEDKSDVKRTIELLLQGYYVALYKTYDSNPKIVVSQNFPRTDYPQTIATDSPRRALEESRLAAVAGPFLSPKAAELFQKAWSINGKELKRSDPDKGYERVGRNLCVSKEMRISMLESWCFLPDSSPIDVTSDAGLEMLNEYLSKEALRRRTTAKGAQGDHAAVDDPVRCRLNFDDDGEEYGYDGEEFYDAADDDVGSSFSNETLGSLGNRFAAMNINSFIEHKDDETISDDELSLFETPPSSPPPTFVVDDVPTKVDNDLFLALSFVPHERLKEYPMVEQFVSKIERLESKARLDWPSLDSPRRAKSFKRLFPHH